MDYCILRDSQTYSSTEHANLISKTCHLVQNSGIKTLESKTRLRIQEADTDTSLVSGSSRGWAAEVVNKWLHDATRRPSATQRLAQKANSQTGIGRFCKYMYLPVPNNYETVAEARHLDLIQLILKNSAIECVKVDLESFPSLPTALLLVMT